MTRHTQRPSPEAAISTKRSRLPLSVPPRRGDTVTATACISSSSLPEPGAGSSGSPSEAGGANSDSAASRWFR